MIAKLLARDVQPPDDAARTLAEKRERRVRDALADMLAVIAGLFGGAAVAALVARYDVASLRDIARSDDATNAVIDAYKPIADVFQDAALAAVNDNLAGAVTHDPFAAVEALTAARTALQAAIVNGADAAVRAVLSEAIIGGMEPAAAARLLQQTAALAPRDMQAVLNYRRMLVNGDRNALARQLRDRRFDATVERATRSPVRVVLTQDQIDAMVKRYAERMLAHRAATIARTETMQAAVGGIRDAYVQAVQSGQLLDSEVTRYWLTAADERVCPVCAAIPDMNRDGVGVNDEYDSPLGPILMPLAHPNCRCSERYVANLTRLRAQPFAMAA